MRWWNVRRAQRLIVRVEVPAEHLTWEQYHDRTEPLMEALLDLEAANPQHFADTGIGSQAGPTPADRFIDVEALVRVESDHVWARVPSLPGCFATGANLEEMREALTEAILMCMEPSRAPA